MTGVLRGVVIAALRDELRVVMVAGEDDGLGQPVTAFDLVAMLHEVLEHPVHRVPVEEPVVDRRRVDPIREKVRFRLVTPVKTLPLGLLLVAQAFVVDALSGKAQVHLLDTGRHKGAVVDGLGQLVGVGRHPRLQLEQVIGVLVHLLTRRRRQAGQQRVKIAEDRAVLLVHRAVGLVDDD